MIKSHLRRLWWTYLPTFQRRTFQLRGEKPNGYYIPLRLTQIVGGRSWSISITRTEAPRPVPPIPHNVFETDMLEAFRSGARHGEWERCISHDADRTLGGLRAALKAAGVEVARPHL